LDYSKSEAEARTPITRALADTLVEARSHFADSDGNTDWRGKTYPYRQWVREIFDDANLRGEDSKRVQSAIRYHVGSSLRARLGEEEAERLGLIPQSPRERSGERRQQRSAVLNALSGRDVAGGALLALTAVSAILQRIEAEEVAGLKGSEREVAEATLKDLERRVRALRRALG
jgi:hypothetical protein